MRIYLSLSKNNASVSFQYQQMLTGALHKWIGKNEAHDDISLYSFSWLSNGRVKDKGLYFDNGSTWFISCHETWMVKKIIEGVQKDPKLFDGMEVKEISIKEPPLFDNVHRFSVASPVFIKRRQEERIKFYYHSDPEASAFMTDTLKKKLLKAGLSADDVLVDFDKTYPNPQIKGTSYYGIHSKGSVCPVIIKGTQEQIQFAWNVGLGNSTGIGFGALN
ncbi:MAG TPA: CRISPR-associated endoribonuclease Cas6 [Cytophagaceae bacterium]|jgi:CRISPR-associated endoribonuclease Cas6